MSVTIRTAVERGCCEMVLADGRRITTEQTFTHYDDWREVEGFGTVNYGRCVLGPQRWIRADTGEPCDLDAEMAAADHVWRQSRSPFRRLLRWAKR